MTREEATRNIKSEMCKNCGVYLGGGECDKDCRVIQCIQALEQDTVPFDFELYEAGLMYMPEEIIEVLDKIKSEIKEWYWQADKRALAKDPCVVDAMIDLFIRTINKYTTERKE